MLHVDVNAPPPASPAKEEDPGSPCINAAVLRGATSPSAMGDEAAAAALRAAKDFYRLFFRWGATDEVAGTPMLRPLRKHVARRSRRNPRPLTPPPHPLLLPRALTSSSSGGTLSSRSSSGGSTHAREGQPQNSNGSEREEMMMRMDAACACASEPQTQWEQPEPGTLLHNGSFDVMAAHRTPNHTFFPPTLNRDHRREVIRAMLGRDARRYSQWRWRRSSIFIEEHHGTSSRATTANNNNNNNSHEAAAVATVPPPMRLGSEAVLFDPQGHLIPDTTTTTSSTTSTITPPPPTTTTTCAGTANVLPRVASATANATQPPTRACSTTHDSHDDGSHVSSPLHPHVSEAAAPELYSIPASHQGPQYFAEAPEDGATTLVILMVGLPARGKTFLAQKICRLLGWHGTRAQVMNLQLLWRRALNAESLSSGATTTTTPPPPQSHHRHSNSVGGLPNNNNSGSFVPVERFRHLITDPGSVERRVYREVLQQAVRDGEAFFRGGGEVFVVNDDFVTEDLRAEAEARFAPLAKQLLFIEVMRDADLNARFLRCKVSDHAEYPKGRISHHDAKRDFFDRLAFLEEVYEPLASCSTDENSSNNNNNNTLVNPERRYIKLVNADYIESHGVRGYLASRIISYAMSLSEVKIQHPIYFVRHGESCYQTEDRIGGNSLLTRQGLSDAAAILEFLESLKGHLQYVDATRQQQQRPLFPSPTAAAPAGEEGGVGEGSWPLHGGFGPTHSLTNNNNNTTTTTTHSMPIESSNNTNTTSPSTTTSYTHHQHHPHHLHGLHPHTHSNSCGSPYAGSSSFAASPHLCIDNSNADNLEVWTSQLRRSIQTAELSEHLLGIRTVYWSSLNEVHAGVCEDMTAAEVRRTYPLIDQFRQQAKYTFRYPEGESYQDLALRLEPVIMELENADKVVVVVAHTAVLRCLLAYFGGTSAERSVHVQVEPGTVWRCIYDSKGIPRLDEVGLERDVALKTVLREMPTTTPRQE